MGTLNTYVSGALFLILVYLLINGRNTNDVIKALSGFNTSAINALQGQNVSTF